MEDDGRTISSGDETHTPTPTPTTLKQKKTRTRTGCLNCRKKKRKCDEGRPACGACSRRNEDCRWGLKLKFRGENAQTIQENHPSMKKGSRRRPSRFEILDITSEIIRDYHHPSRTRTDSYDTDPPSGDKESATVAQSSAAPPLQTHRGTAEGASPIRTRRESSKFYHSYPISTMKQPIIGPEPRTSSSTDTRTFEGGIQRASNMEPPVQIDQAVVNLLYLSQGQPPPPEPSENAESPHTQSPHFQDFTDGIITGTAASPEDGIFLPGSTYHELHSTLRTHLLSQVTAPSVHEPTATSPLLGVRPVDAPCLESGTGSGSSDIATSGYISDGHKPPPVSRGEELRLWKNWITEIAPWLDKFDNARTFQHQLPDLSRSHPHLRYAILALSARQIERMDAASSLRSSTTATISDRGGDTSLMLYQEAIHLLLPTLHTRTTPVIASCVVLCVLEMLSCSPKAWRRHLDGCASLLQASRITGFSGGSVEKALFWCFVRMDLCGGLINGTRTLIPASRWASTVGDLDADMGLFRASNSAFDTCANCAVYLGAQVLDLFASRPTSDEAQYASSWIKLWRYLDDWHAQRPPEMYPVMTMPPPPRDPSKPFPTILYSNGPAISGNQQYHTSALLMLQNKPQSIRSATLLPMMGSSHASSPTRRCSILWHARQICAISMSNEHHGAWTNSIQPIWIAGRCMSHPAEHRSILLLLDKIERECGWATKWRSDDLKEFWGDLGD
ncbi:Transcription activator AMTR1 [Zalerion maritima]|uniref:Transcription activator AMTR1 n=1 Tax=Zalerion maritima TaxID=339359 RepID=A0AAD5RKP7_9PEZI|nr:Transcription activator AMTR1 [Zalerion maritima]